jgi:hypothetical protein
LVVLRVPEAGTNEMKKTFFGWGVVDLVWKASQFPCPQKDSREHGAIEAASVGVAQGWVVCGKQMQAVGKKILGAVGEAVLGFAGDDACFDQEREIAVEGYLSQADDDADTRQSLDLSGEMTGAVANLLGVRLVAGRGASDDGGDPGVAELEAVVAADGAGFAGEAELMKDGIHEVAGAVAGEGAAGAIGSVGAGREAEDEDSGAGVAKAGDRPGPIDLVLIGTAFGFADAATVGAKAGAALAGDDGFMNLLEELRRYLCVGGCHCIP